MRKKIIICPLLLALVLSGCSNKKDVEPSTYPETTEVSTEVTTEKETEPTTQATTAPEIILTTEEPTNGADSKLDTITQNYEDGGIVISYPQIIGLRADEAEEKANKALKEHVLSVIEAYHVDPQKDKLEISHNILTLYRGQISVLYLGSLTRDGSDDPINLCFTDNINLITHGQIRLNSRYSADGIKKLLSQDKNYEIISANTTQFEALKDHLAKQNTKYYEDLIANGDFGGDGYPVAFSYSNGTTLHLIINVPHILGDYVEITAIQKIK